MGRLALTNNKSRGIRDWSSLLLSSFLWLLILGSTGQQHQVMAVGLGGEKAFVAMEDIPQGFSYRQNVCERYEMVANQTLQLKDALNGLNLYAVVSAYDGAFFEYDPVEGISGDYAGLAAIIMDELARRGRFQWRNTFAVTYGPGNNETWDDLMMRGVETFDVFVEWWSPNLERMNLGVAFVKDWYDASIILLKRAQPEVISDEINFWNWLRPYDYRVWLLTIFTILLSGLVYQWLEWLQDERGDRSIWDWWLENWYLSSMNFTQAYEYQPRTLASRLFGISMAIWALVMTATYTANLASLLVDRKQTFYPERIDEIGVFGYSVCTWEDTAQDAYIRENHPTVRRVPKKTVLEQYQGLLAGECDFMAEAKASWLRLEGNSTYNPFCDIEWVGGDREIKKDVASFITKADSGRKCTGLIRDVLNWHMENVISDEFLKDAWAREYKRRQDRDCSVWRPEMNDPVLEGLFNESSCHRFLRNENYNQIQSDRSTGTGLHQYNDQITSRWQRQLKAGGKGAAGGAVAASAAAEESEETNAERLTLEQMIGTFAFHWTVMLISLVIAHANFFYAKYVTKPTQKEINSVSVMTNQTTKTKMMDETSECYAEESGNGPARESASSLAHNIAFSSFNSFNNSNNNACNQQDLQAALATMRRSQVLMQDFQKQMLEEHQTLRKQMLEEQRQLQKQIQELTGAAPVRRTSSLRRELDC